MDVSTLFLSDMSGPLAYRLTNDYMFHALMQESDEALRGLLSALLPIPYEEIRSCQILNPIILGRAMDEKTCILDVRVCLNNDRLINLEMQVAKYEHWANRALFYLCRLFCNLSSGKDYEGVLPAIHIGILNTSPFDEVQKFYSKYELVDVENLHKFTGNFSLRVLDLSQTDSVSAEALASGAVSRELYDWACLFRATTWEEIKMIAAKNEHIHEAARHFHILTQDKDIRLQCEARERYELDMASARAEGLRHGQIIGEEIGRKIGEENGRKIGEKIGEANGRKIGEKIGEANGRKIGEATAKQQINQLCAYLIRDGRLDDLTRSIEDPAYQEQLLKEYGIVSEISAS